MKLREPFTYFVDRSLGRALVVEALRAARLEWLKRPKELKQLENRDTIASVNATLQSDVEQAPLDLVTAMGWTTAFEVELPLSPPEAEERGAARGDRGRGDPGHRGTPAGEPDKSRRNLEINSDF